MIPALTEEDKVRIRHHLGYLNVTEASSMALGVPTALPHQHMIEAAMTRAKPEALPLIRRLLDTCDAVEMQMAENTENQAVTSLGNISINKGEFEQLRTENLPYWRKRLADAFGVEVNPYTLGAGNGINVRVSG